MLNQDPIENLFAVIRQYGAGSNNPDCFQFISALKTSILNNLVSNKSYSENCEKDEGKILDNLRDYLVQNETPQISDALNNTNELLRLQIPVFNQNNAFIDKYNLQALNYVCGFLIKKLNCFGCVNCKKDLTTENLEDGHIFTLYKEYDKKLRLNYTSKHFSLTVACIFDAISFYLARCGEITGITKKIKEALSKIIVFDWISCAEHVNELKNQILTITMRIVIFKILNDIQKEFIKEQNDKKYKKRINIFQHISGGS